MPPYCLRRPLPNYINPNIPPALTMVIMRITARVSMEGVFSLFMFDTHLMHGHWVTCLFFCVLRDTIKYHKLNRKVASIYDQAAHLRVPLRLLMGNCILVVSM